MRDVPAPEDSRIHASVNTKCEVGGAPSRAPDSEVARHGISLMAFADESALRLERSS